MTLSNEPLKDYFPLAIQISAEAWRSCGLPPDLARDLPASPLYPLQRVAEGLRRKNPERAASAGQLNLLALLNASYRLVAGRYLALRRCAIGLDEAGIAGRTAALPTLRPTLEAFVRLYPPAAVWNGATAAVFLQGEDGPARRLSTVVELFILATQMANPGAGDLATLFDDTELRRCCPYQKTLAELEGQLAQEPAAGLFGRPLGELLMAPVQAAPHSLAGQLEYIQRHWAEILPPELLRHMLTAFDVLREEQLARGAGPGPTPVPRFGGYAEPEAFSTDTDWMSRVVLIAKSVYVWLDQLAKKYGRPLTRLDDIPDQELDTLAQWGINALWLIGLWERSSASQKIKQIRGNPEAVASAYSLYDYVVAGELGGEEALAELEARCAARGIRLASDVVPNHTGIYSKWMKEHPDWFVQLSHPPYLSYRFTGPDLSPDEAIGLFIEDGYYDHSDAAVVFKQVDNRTGKVRYIYHGNDGTHMPWNDTAQLNYLLPEVREAVIRTIVQIARRFRIIRFDAAMTLAKKHYQRLWFPQPGGGAGVPSRAEHWMSREEFDRVFPQEFWREVVDRVAAEVPDTLLVAEAFWLMEGYFVRTLGMHRVYNSAFMHMLKQEENAKYRSVIKNILEFNPEILKRFVNFMNNPDEATAVEQFGKGDKYFGVAVLLATMPGLPMFGHGQVEGFKEKYGMEYRRAYWDETIDEGFVRHHEAQIFPLLHRRHLFSEAGQFALYDFVSGGHVNEDVFAYSNRHGQERALVVYHNRHAETGGWIRDAAPRMVRENAGGERLVRSTLGEALGIKPEDGYYYRFRDFRTGLEYLRPGKELVESGLYLQLGPYHYHVFLDFKEIRDEDGSWRRLGEQLSGRPVPDLDHEIRKIRYAPLLEAFKGVLSPQVRERIGLLLAGENEASKGDALNLLAQRSAAFFSALAQTAQTAATGEALAAQVTEELDALSWLADLKSHDKEERAALAAFRQGRPEGPGEERRVQFYRVFLPWLTLHRIGELVAEDQEPERSARWAEEYLLNHALRETLQHQAAEQTASAEALLVQLLIRHQTRFLPGEDFRRSFTTLLNDPLAKSFLECHWHDTIQWFSKERLEALAFWFFFITGAQAPVTLGGEKVGLLRHLAELHHYFTTLLQGAEEVRYQVDKFSEFV